MTRNPPRRRSSPSARSAVRAWATSRAARTGPTGSMTSESDRRSGANSSGPRKSGVTSTRGHSAIQYVACQVPSVRTASQLASTAIGHGVPGGRSARSGGGVPSAALRAGLGEDRAPSAPGPRTPSTMTSAPSRARREGVHLARQQRAPNPATRRQRRGPDRTGTCGTHRHRQHHLVPAGHRRRLVDQGAVARAARASRLRARPARPRTRARLRRRRADRSRPTGRGARHEPSRARDASTRAQAATRASWSSGPSRAKLWPRSASTAVNVTARSVDHHPHGHRRQRRSTATPRSPARRRRSATPERTALRLAPPGLEARRHRFNIDGDRTPAVAPGATGADDRPPLPTPSGPPAGATAHRFGRPTGQNARATAGATLTTAATTPAAEGRARSDEHGHHQARRQPWRSGRHASRRSPPALERREPVADTVASALRSRSPVAPVRCGAGRDQTHRRAHRGRGRPQRACPDCRGSGRSPSPESGSELGDGLGDSAGERPRSAGSSPESGRRSSQRR